MDLFGSVSLAIIAGSMMRINWVFSEGYQLDPTIEIEMIKTVGPSWGSWRTWRACGTDNVICHDVTKARELLQRAFHAVCNFYLPAKNFADLGRPAHVQLYDGDYNQEVISIEDIISVHLAASQSDLVLLAGFNLSKPEVPADRFQRHRVANYHGLLRSAMASNVQTQWVVLDHAQDLDESYAKLSNLTCDSMQNALQLLL
jgi:hypothetical protein